MGGLAAQIVATVSSLMIIESVTRVDQVVVSYTKAINSCRKCNIRNQSQSSLLNVRSVMILTTLVSKSVAVCVVRYDLEDNSLI